MNTNEKQTQDKKLSCAYCAVTNCNAMDKNLSVLLLTNEYGRIVQGRNDEDL